MPLHIIPLCDFKYAGEIYSGATFKYDTAGKISKVKLKLLSKSSKEFEKNSKKLLYRDTSDMLKNNKRYLSSESCKIGNKNFTKELKANIKGLDKIYKMYLLRIESLCFIKNSTFRLRKNNSLINVESGVNLDVAKDNELNLKSSRELSNGKNSCLDIEKSKELGNAKNNYLSIELGKPMLRIYGNKFNKEEAFNLIDHGRKNILLGKCNDIFLSKSAQILDKDKPVELIRSYIGDVCKFTERYIIRNNIKQISFDLSKRLYGRYNLKDVFKIKNKFINKIAIKKIGKMNYQFTLKKDSSKRIIKNYDENYLSKLNLKRISSSIKARLLYKWSIKSISKMNAYGLNKIVFKNIFKNNYKLLRKITDKNIYCSNDDIGLILQEINNIAKISDRYLKSTASMNIYKQLEKGLFDLTVTDIAQIQSYYLGNDLNREVYKEGRNNKFIDIIKRWWWLNPTDPRDSIIIPNKDFDYDSSLLNNPDYEYLRFTNHPIGWGASWGIDFNIPAYAVSIEIMLDLVNILIMIWHHDVQAWMCCSGKESMQFVMEILYDWYTLDTSKPNADYYRAYRWIRWEAEKVYFLNLDTGLQAVGVLIANLIDYLKYHEFNSVLLWRNPKAMAIERNFNRMAQNGDLMRNLDKVKGKRYYYIETQNIEKKNILGR
ncbi:hypothetical protein [Clostridium coskatii]|uniref:Uncharacterized protein n=1 Tax=Clostridium coskatii TaxID=1705578 RepID=A0A162JBC9_9CLOT|nr:hypothetical protein [Clostridium coskatii]OAA92995.1 hypothetical protein WX73_00313 [Clostridium coskatii]OBR90463.1 hypothetical protein CLCOS_40210 [Clostridium coskatii]